MTFGRTIVAKRVLGETPEVGDRVDIVAGRYAGSRGELVAIERVPTPSRSVALVAVVRRPRAGDTIVFVSEIRRVDE